MLSDCSVGTNRLRAGRAWGMPLNGYLISAVTITSPSCDLSVPWSCRRVPHFSEQTEPVVISSPRRRSQGETTHVSKLSPQESDVVSVSYFEEARLPSCLPVA